MSKRTDQNVRRRLGIYSPLGVWCTIGDIPEPPKEVHAAAGGGRLRPGMMRPWGVLAWILGAPLLLVAILYGVIDYYGDLLVSRKARAEYRERKETGRRHKGLLREHGLDQTFDGDWHRGAGQLLLRWYSQSSHPSRLVLLDAGRIVLAAPPKRVTVGRDKKIQIVAEIPGDQAVIEDPLLGQVESDKLRVRFTDGSWLVLNVGERPNDIHRYLETVRDSGGGSGTRNLPVYVG